MIILCSANLFNVHYIHIDISIDIRVNAFFAQSFLSQIAVKTYTYTTNEHIYTANLFFLYHDANGLTNEVQATRKYCSIYTFTTNLLAIFLIFF